MDAANLTRFRGRSSTPTATQSNASLDSRFVDETLGLSRSFPCSKEENWMENEMVLAAVKKTLLFLATVISSQAVIDCAAVAEVNVVDEYGVMREEDAGPNETFDNLDAIQNALDAADGNQHDLYFPAGTYRVVCKKVVSSVFNERREGSLYFSRGNVKLRFENGAKILAVQESETHYQPLFIARTVHNIVFEGLTVEWEGQFLLRDNSGNGYFALGLEAANRNAILLFSNCNGCRVTNITTRGADEDQCYNHGIFTEDCFDFVVDGVIAEHYGSWWFAKADNENDPDYSNLPGTGVTIKNGFFEKQSLRTLNQYGPGHPVYTFSDHFHLENLCETGVLQNYSEDVLNVAQDGRIETQNGRFDDTYRFQVYDNGGNLIDDEFVMRNKVGRTFELFSTQTDAPPPVGISKVEYTPGSAGHTIKIREFSSPLDGIVVKDITSKSPGGLIIITDDVKGEFTNLEWDAPYPFYQSSIGGTAILNFQGSTFSEGIYDCVFDGVTCIDAFGADLRYMTLRGANNQFLNHSIDTSGEAIFHLTAAYDNTIECEVVSGKGFVLIDKKNSGNTVEIDNVAPQ
ncbi:MAG: hypothetical protein AAF989_09100 [Planctomycetota bacterium]